MGNRVIKHIHATTNSFNPTVYFTLDGRLLSFEVCTPAFNDYNEWRVSFMGLTKLEYKHNEEVQLNPLKGLSEIKIDDESYEMFNDMGDLEQELLSDEEVSIVVDKYKHGEEDFSEFDEFIGGFGENKELLISLDNKYVNYDRLFSSKDISPFNRVMGPIFKEIVLWISNTK